MFDFTDEDIKRVMKPDTYFIKACVKVLHSAIHGKTAVSVKGKTREIESLHRHFSTFGFKVTGTSKKIRVGWS